MKAYLLLEDGSVYEGQSVGTAGTVIGEIVFTTAMTGYQESLTDPSYFGQIMMMTYPLVGNYGVSDEDNESEKIQVRGFIVRSLCKAPSNWRMTDTLESFLKKQSIVAIEGIDTRALTQKIREAGVMNGVLTTDPDFSVSRYMDEIKAYTIRDAVKSVTCAAPYEEKAQESKFRVAVYDLGVKRKILKNLIKVGFDITVFPASTPAQAILDGGFDGVMLTNGPGDPKECTDVIESIRVLIQNNMPIFGICLGHQLVALAQGLDTKKMKYGHRGSNHPVTDLNRDRTYITSQNHGYVVVADSLDPSVGEVTHKNLNDGTVEGIRYKGCPVFTVQFHPEASQGPLDTEYLFHDFKTLMEVHRNA